MKNKKICVTHLWTVNTIWLAFDSWLGVWNCGVRLSIVNQDIPYLLRRRAAIPSFLKIRWLSINSIATAWDRVVRVPWPTTLIGKSVLIILISLTSRTVYKAGDLPFIIATIWTRLSTQNSSLLSIASFFILILIRWALRVRMVRTCSPMFFMVPMILQSVCDLLAGNTNTILVLRAYYYRKLEVQIIHDTTMKRHYNNYKINAYVIKVTCVSLGGLSVDLPPAYFLST